MKMTHEQLLRLMLALGELGARALIASHRLGAVATAKGGLLSVDEAEEALNGVGDERVQARVAEVLADIRKEGAEA